jgi:hypothetical protein
MTKKLIGIQGVRAPSRHITIPVKFLRQAIVEKENNVEKFYVKFLGNNDRVEISKETYGEVVAALEYA